MTVEPICPYPNLTHLHEWIDYIRSRYLEERYCKWAQNLLNAKNRTRKDNRVQEPTYNIGVFYDITEMKILIFQTGYHYLIASLSVYRKIDSPKIQSRTFRKSRLI